MKYSGARGMMMCDATFIAENEGRTVTLSYRNRLGQMRLVKGIIDKRFRLTERTVSLWSETRGAVVSVMKSRIVGVTFRKHDTLVRGGARA